MNQQENIQKKRYRTFKYHFIQEYEEFVNLIQ